MNIPAVLEAFKETLKTFDGDVYAGMPDAPTPPCVCIRLDTPFTYDVTAAVTFTLLCLIGSTDSLEAQTTLMGWISDDGPISIPALIDADSTLGGTVSSVIPYVNPTWGYGQVQEGRARLLQAEIVCNVLR